MAYIDYLLGAVISIAVLGVLFSFWALYDCLNDLHALHHDPDHTTEALMITTQLNFAQEIIRTVLQGIFVAAAMSQVSTEEMPTITRPMMTMSIMVLCACLLVLLASIWGRMGRYRLAVVLARIAIIPKSETNIIEAVHEGTTAAKSAYHEANDINKKIAALSKEIIGVQKEQEKESQEPREPPAASSVADSVETLQEIEKHTAETAANTKRTTVTIQETQAATVRNSDAIQKNTDAIQEAKGVTDLQ